MRVAPPLPRAVVPVAGSGDVMRSGHWAGWLGLLSAGLGSVSGCAGSASPGTESHACFRALDCAAGLVCVEGRCTADLGPIVPEGAGQAPEGATAASTSTPDAGQ